MNAELMLAHYERIAQAPDAIARLRRFVLDLAVRGKLVEQDPNDEPVSQLLKRIASEKAKLAKAGRIKARGNLPAVNAEDVPYCLPSSWQWLRFADLVEFYAGRTPSRNDLSYWNTGDYSWVSIADMTDGGMIEQTKETVSRFAKESVFKSEPEPIGTMIMSFKLTIGKIARLGVPAFHNEAIISIHPHFNELDGYLFMALPELARGGDTKGAIKGATLNRDSLSSILIPLPPLPEQQRVVAKVDELMALCDQLETAQAECEMGRDKLTLSTLAKLNEPDPETFADDARFALEHLEPLTKRTDQVKQLRQTILNLAVRGKLVEQDPSDEPCGLPGVSMSEALPFRWRYVRLQEILSENTRNGYSRRPDDAPNGVPILRISAGTVRRDGLISEEEHKLISGIDARTRLQYGLKKGDLLACRFNGNKANVGRLTMFSDYLGLDPIYPDKLIRVRCNAELAMPEFICMSGESDMVRTAIEQSCATTVGNWGISAGNLKDVPFPLPPIAEQHRIVAKVDELMALCDQLEASIAEGEQIRSNLLEAVLHEALEPAEKTSADLCEVA